MRNIAFKRPGGAVSISYLATAGDDPRTIEQHLRARGDIPADWVTLGYDVAVPESRERRDQWRWENGAIVVPPADDLPRPQDVQPVEG